MERFISLSPARRAAIAASAAVFACAWIGGAATEPALVSWYPALAKPWFTPPNWVFPVAWTALFAAMGYASWLVWRDGGDGARWALTVYGGNLALNALWSVVFFGMRSPAAGLIVLVPLLGSTVASAWLFAGGNRVAGALMVPYVAWVSFAGALNAAIWWMN